MSEATEVFEAVASGDLARVRELLARDPSLVHCRDAELATPLHLATLRGNQELAQLLVERGADVNARDGRFGATPAGWAIEYLRGLGGFLAIEIEDMLLAIRQEDTAWVRRFLTRLPAFARCRDSKGKPLLQHAEEARDPEISRLFREAAENSRR